MFDILQPTHLIFILVVALIVLGPKRLPEVGRSLGKGLRDFRQAMSGIEAEASNIFSTEPSATQSQPGQTLHTVEATVVSEPQRIPEPQLVREPPMIEAPQPLEAPQPVQETTAVPATAAEPASTTADQPAAATEPAAQSPAPVATAE